MRDVPFLSRNKVMKVFRPTLKTSIKSICNSLFSAVTPVWTASAENNLLKTVWETKLRNAIKVTLKTVNLSSHTIESTTKSVKCFSESFKNRYKEVEWSNDTFYKRFANWLEDKLAIRIASETLNQNSSGRQQKLYDICSKRFKRQKQMW